jgi:hypothetical protein
MKYINLVILSVLLHNQNPLDFNTPSSQLGMWLNAQVVGCKIREFKLDSQISLYPKNIMSTENRKGEGGRSAASA